jgi:VanZ family protein
MTAATPPSPAAVSARPRPAATPLARLLAVATAGYVGVLVYATHHPRPQELIGEGPGTPSDKALHLWAYSVLGLLAAATLAAWRPWTIRAAAALTAGLFAFGAADEITQPIFGRYADFRDWIADCGGSVAGVLAIAALLAAAGRLAGPRGGERRADP